MNLPAASPVIRTALESFEAIPRNECCGLLSTASVGRLALNLDALPAVFPVEIRQQDESILISVSRGRLERATEGSVVTVEVDDLDPADGWSVMVTGVASRPAPQFAPPAGEGTIWLEVPLTVVSGRRLNRPKMVVSGAVRPEWSTDTPAGEAPARPAESRPLTAQECSAVLGQKDVGRLVLLVDGRPQVFPVNYALDSECVVFRTARGSVLARSAGSLVVFQADHLDPGTGHGWTVAMEALSEAVSQDTAPALHQRLERLNLHPWAPGERSLLVRLTATRVEGVRWNGRPVPDWDQSP